MKKYIFEMSVLFSSEYDWFLFWTIFLFLFAHFGHFGFVHHIILTTVSFTLLAPKVLLQDLHLGQSCHSKN